MPGAHCCTLATWNKGNKFSVGLAHLLLGRRESESWTLLITREHRQRMALSGEFRQSMKQNQLYQY